MLHSTHSLFMCMKLLAYSIFKCYELGRTNFWYSSLQKFCHRYVRIRKCVFETVVPVTLLFAVDDDYHDGNSTNEIIEIAFIN